MSLLMGRRVGWSRRSRFEFGVPGLGDGADGSVARRRPSALAHPWSNP